MFTWLRTRSDCGVEMEKAISSCTRCAYSRGIWVAPFVIRLCELGKPVLTGCWTEDEMDCMTEVPIEAHVEGLSGDAGALLPRTSIAGVVWVF